MAKKLGKIDKPEAFKFKGKKKLYLVPLIFTWEDAPEEYKDKFNLCWQQIEEQLTNLEHKIGKIKRIYHESVAVEGDGGLKIVEKLNPAGFKIASKKHQKGATFESLEDEESVSESLDWQRMLLLGFASAKVAKMVSDYYAEATRRRYEHISSRLNETIKDGEASLLFIREGHMVQFPKDLEVFSISPPALDEIHRWLKEQTATKPADDKTKEKGDASA
jgi:hypothetical protein